MKITKNQKILGVFSILILLISIAITLLDAFVTNFDVFASFKLHEILTFLFCIFVGFGILLFYAYMKSRCPFYLFIGAILIGLAFIYAFVMSMPDFWWISLIVVAVVWAVMAIFSFMYSGNLTESIAENDSPDYKNYEQRKAEKKPEEKKELPEIKSYKE